MTSLTNENRGISEEMEQFWHMWEAEDVNGLYEFLREAQQQGNTLITEEEVNKLHPHTGKALVHVACAKGHLNLVQMLCSYVYFDVNVREKHNNVTPMMYAARDGHDHIMEYLVITRAGEGGGDDSTLDINAQDRDGYTALHYACINKHIHTVEILCSQPGCDVNIRDNEMRTPLHRGVECLQFALVKMLLNRKDSDVNAQNHHGWTALHYASYNQMQRTCSLLIQKGADTEMKDSRGKKPLFFGYGFWEEEGGCTCPKHR